MSTKSSNLLVLTLGFLAELIKHGLNSAAGGKRPPGENRYAAHQGIIDGFCVVGFQSCPDSCLGCVWIGL